MSWLVVRRIWVTTLNLMFVAFVALALVDDYHFYSISDVPKLPRPPWLDLLIRLSLIAALLTGILLDWSGRAVPAVVLNAGLFAVFGLGALIQISWGAITNLPNPYPAEARLAVAVAGVLVGFAVVTCLLYWRTQPASE